MTLIDAQVPIGYIGIFPKGLAPDGWRYCDGTDGTPNLTDRCPLTLEDDKLAVYFMWMGP